MFRIIPDLMQALVSNLPAWALIPLAVVTFMLILPQWLHYVRAKQLRGKLRKMARSETQGHKERLEDEAFSLAALRPRLLLILLEDGHRLNHSSVWRRARDMLNKHRLAPKDVRAFNARVQPTAKRITHPIEAAVKIEGLWTNGLTGQALLHLEESLVIFPDDDELKALKQTLRFDPVPTDSAGS